MKQQTSKKSTPIKSGSKPHKFLKKKETVIYSKKVEKPHKLFKFPNISRVITDGISGLWKDIQTLLKEIQLFFKNLGIGTYLRIKRYSARPVGAVVVMGALTIIFIIPVVFIGSDVNKTLIERQVVFNERQKIETEKEYWVGIVTKHPNYRDGYFKLALLEYQLKNYNESRTHLEKTLQLDPNFEKGRELEKILND